MTRTVRTSVLPLLLWTLLLVGTVACSSAAPKPQERTATPSPGAANATAAPMSCEEMPGVITTIAGITTTDVSAASEAATGDGGPALDARLDLPIEVAVDEIGNVFILELAHGPDNPGRIRKVDTRGRITTVVGAPTQAGAPIAAGEAGRLTLSSPFGMTFDTEGNVYVADSAAHRVVRIAPSGEMDVVAGTGKQGVSADGGQATGARLSFPIDVAIDGDGNLYFPDNEESRIRKVDPVGVITTIAGTGKLGFSGDGGPAIDARISDPRAIAVDERGNVYFADAGNGRIRMIDRFGTIRTVAGGGKGHRLGDGGLATNATLVDPTGLWVNEDGSFFIGEESRDRVRFVDASGVITTVAGTGTRGFSGDGGPATDAKLDTPVGMTVGSDGTLYIADFENARIRMVCPQPESEIE